MGIGLGSGPPPSAMSVVLPFWTATGSPCFCALELGPLVTNDETPAKTSKTKTLNQA